MCGMPTSDVADRGDDLRGYAETVAALVPGDVVCDESEARRQCAWGSTNTRPGRYQTAWTWLHKLRRAMVRPGRELLNGEVEVDKTYVGGREVGRYGAENKQEIDCRDCRRNPGSGHRSYPHGACSRTHPAESLIPFVQTAVCPGATIRTDGWRAYNGLTGVGFEHQPKNISASGDPAHIVMPQVHRVAGLLDRWWLGIHHGAISASQLDYYLDEFTFRFNRRRSKARGLLFYRLLQQAVQLEPVPYKKLVGGRPSPAPQI